LQFLNPSHSRFHPELKAATGNKELEQGPGGNGVLLDGGIAGDLLLL
jgi:hypothetical protein